MVDQPPPVVVTWWTIVGWVAPVISATAAAVSAVAAMVATRLAFKTQVQHRAELRAQRQQRYYAQLISDHAIQQTSDFVEQSRPLLESGVNQRRERAEGNEPFARLQEDAQRLIAAWNDQYYAFSRTLLLRIEAWGDAGLRARVRLQLEKLQDDIVQSIEQLCLGADRADFDALLITHAGNLLALIMQTDPGLSPVSVS
jgi:hypothetical protein